MASKRRIRRRRCTSKVRYENQTKAVSVLIGLKRIGVLTEQHRTYLCPFCNGFHIGRGKLSELERKA